jgi:iron complex transport system ATP-binding protein
MRISAQALTVSYGARAALADVSLALQPGAMVGLIGPNGAGKTTLIRALAGLMPPSGGEILYDDAPAAKMPRQMRARKIAYLAQSGSAEWPLQVEAIVALGRLPHRRALAAPGEADIAAVERALAAAELGAFRQRTLGELSGGERARVLIARALAVEADWLLADEPIAALDPLHQLRAMALLRAEAKRGAGVVAVLHDLTLAVRFCDRLILLNDGRIRLDGPPAELTPQAIADAYGVEALYGEHRGESFVLPWAAIER